MWAALARGGHLVTITSEAENTLLVDLFDAEVDGFVWIAASDRQVEGDWRWEAGSERGTPLSYANWGRVEPNNFGDEDVAALNLGPLSPGGTATGEWGDTRTVVLFPGYSSPALHDPRAGDPGHRGEGRPGRRGVGHHGSCWVSLAGLRSCSTSPATRPRSI